MKRYRAVIYDVDGTLLNTLNMNMIPLMRIIKEETGEDWTFDEVLRFASYPGMKVMEELKVRDPQNVYARWVRYVNEYEEGASLYEGIEKVLQSFQKAGIIQAVVTAKTRRQYEIDVVSRGIDRYMRTAVLADDTERHKPDPEPLLLCLKRLEIPKEDAVYIGDAASDSEAAARAGMDFGYAEWGSVSRKGILNPAYIFHKPDDLFCLMNESR